jgi:hypothetical protein
LNLYEMLSAEVVRRSSGGVMYGGAALSDLGGVLVAVTVAAYRAAEIYQYNVARWLQDPSLADLRDQFEDLSSGLGDLTARIEAQTSVSWLVRQIVLAAD